MSLCHPAEGYFIRRRGSLLAPLITGVAVAAVVLAGQTRLGAWLRGYLASSRRIRLGEQLVPFDDGNFSFEELREWLLGRNMAMIVDAFGPPRMLETAASTVSAARDAGAGAFWRSDLWYYRLDPRTQTAMAIHFVAGVAQQVDFFEFSTALDA